MSKTQYRKILRKLNITQAQAAEMFGVTVRTANAWANGARIPKPVAQLLRILMSGVITVEDLP